MIRTWLRARKRRHELNKLFKSPSISRVFEDGAGVPTLTPSRIEFVAIFVRGASPEEQARRMAAVVDISRSNDAMVCDIVAGLVITVFGAEPVPRVIRGSRSSLIAELRTEFGDSIKIAHGSADGHIGLVGNSDRCAYTFLLPGFDSVLEALGGAQFGEVLEV